MVLVNWKVGTLLVTGKRSNPQGDMTGIEARCMLEDDKNTNNMETLQGVIGSSCPVDFETLTARRSS